VGGRKVDISDAELTAYLETALESEHGIEIKTHHLDYLRRRFYVAIKLARDSGDLRFDALKISTSPHTRGCLWIMKETEECED
jgi:hypothetical protein